MTDAVTAGARPKRNNGAAHAPVLVSGVKLALHFGCVRQHVDHLALQGVIERRADGLFDQDQSRLKYLNHLRSEHRRSPRAAADAEHALAKAALLRIQVEEKRRKLMLVSDHNAFVDELAGLVLTKLSGLPARVAGADLGARRRAEAVILEMRREMAAACEEMAAKAGEPPPDTAT